MLFIDAACTIYAIDTGIDCVINFTNICLFLTPFHYFCGSWLFINVIVMLNQSKKKKAICHSTIFLQHWFIDCTT